MSQPIIEIKHLQKNFGSTKALKDITFNVDQGEVFGFIGPNGAGKSTTIRILLGMLKKSGGQATILNHDVWSETKLIHPHIAYVPGDVYLWPNLTGGEIIDFLLKLHGQAHTARVDELIKLFQLDITKRAHTYSKGNRQKIALVAAFATDADLYIFDEPTSGLDPLMEDIFRSEVEKLKQAGKTILLSSHILSEVEKMGDRIGIIRDGQMIEVGNLNEMRQLSRTMIVVSTKNPIDNLTLPGVHNVKTKDNEYQMSVDSDQIGAVIEKLSQYQVLSLQANKPTLDDLFLRYYNQKGDNR